MEIVMIYSVVILLGLVLGSFAGATVWRLRARQLIADKKSGEPYNKAELKRLKPLAESNVKDDRSRCLDCGHTLAWYDLLPIVSWVSTKGRCRYCHTRIGTFEPLIELGMAGLFTATTYWWLGMAGMHPLAFVVLALWLAAVVMLVILFAYDQKWFLLPDVVMVPLIGLSVVITVVTYMLLRPGDLVTYLLSVAASILVLSGLYLALWLVSRGAWVGFGDVKLGLALGLLVADWKLALLTLFLANLIGTLLVLPGLIRKKVSRQTQVPFGPLLIVGFFLSLFAGEWLIKGYIAFSDWLASAMLML